MKSFQVFVFCLVISFPFNKGINSYEGYPIYSEDSDEIEKSGTNDSQKIIYSDELENNYYIKEILENFCFNYLMIYRSGYKGWISKFVAKCK